MTTPNEQQPGESTTAWGIRQVKEEGAREVQARIKLALETLFDGRHCRERDPGCVCELGSRQILRTALDAVVTRGI